MTLHEFQDRPSSSLVAALAEFESQFTYPLGPGRSFRISHGDDYLRFFRAMGPAKCFIAEERGHVVGAIGIAIRQILLPNGAGQTVAYIGDLKIDSRARGTFVFLRLARAALAWAAPQVRAAFGVVMDGTRVSPATYTGRMGIPSFLQISNIAVLRIATAQVRSDQARDWTATSEQGEICYRQLGGGHYAAAGGTPALRSIIAPQWLVRPEGDACGRLEDTRAAKRLIDSDGREMLSAHLNCAAWSSARAAADLIRAAGNIAAQNGLPALFVSVNPAEVGALQAALAGAEITVAPATIYGVGLKSGLPWNINTSEI